MEQKTEIVDDIAQQFLPEQGYMVHAEDLEGIIT